MKDPLTLAIEALSNNFREHAKRLRRLEVKSTTSFSGTDTEAPSVPTNLAADAVSYHQVNLTWTASTDNIGVSGYTIYRNGDFYTTTGSVQFNDFNVSGGTTYSYAIDAFDLAGNHSAHTAQVFITTPGSIDTTPPSTPQVLTATSVLSTSVQLSWLASTDNVGVTNYTLYRNGVPIAAPTPTNYTDNNVLPNTSYTYSVDAVDAAGNHSGQSTAIVVNTPPIVGSNVWYVSPTGLSTNTGAIDSPWNLDHALNGAGGGAVVAGHTIYLRDGTYTVSSAAQIVTGFTGSSSSRIVVRAYPGEHPMLTSTNGTSHDLLEIRNCSYVDFMFLDLSISGENRASEIVGGGLSRLVFENTSYTQSNCRWYNCWLHDSPGIAFYSPATSNATEINGCFFYYNGSKHDIDWNVWFRSATGNTKIIKDSVIIHSAADGVRCYSTTSDAVDGITITGIVTAGIGSLYANAGNGVLAAGTTTPVTNMSYSTNTHYNIGVTPDVDSSSLHLGHIGSSTGGTTTFTKNPVTGGDDGRWYSDGTTFDTAGTVIHVGQISGVRRSGFMRFPNVIVPPGATITAAKVTVMAGVTRSAGVAYMKIRGDKSTLNPTAPTTNADATGRTRTTANVSWNPPAITTGSSYDTPDLTSVVQELVNQASWASGNAIVLYWDEDGGLSTNDVEFDTFESAGTKELLSITYSNGGTFSAATAASTDDGRWGSGGTTYNTNAGNLQIGLVAGEYMSSWTRFPNVTIPKGATINTAYITIHSGTTVAASAVSVKFRGDKSAISPAAPSSNSDATTRTRTTANVVYSNTAWTLGSIYNTPDLTAVIQELVNQPSWASGSAMNIFWDENGHTSTDVLTPETFDNAVNMPVLNVTYTATTGDAGVNAFTGSNSYLVGDALDLSGGAASGSGGGGTGGGGGSTNNGAIGAGTYTYTPPAATTTYYVSTTGVDTNSGTITSPFRTIAKGATMLGPGVRVYVRGGTYSEILNVSANGTSSANQAQLMSYPGEVAAIDGAGLTTGTYGALFSITGNFMYVSGFEVRNAQGVNVYITGSNTIVDGLYVHHCKQNGILVSASASYSIVQNCKVYRTAMANEYAAASVWAGGLNVARYPDHIIVRNNTIWEIWGESASAFNATNVTFSHNIIHDNFSAGIYISDATGCVCDGNFIYDDPTNYVFPYGAHIGLQSGNENCSPANANNTFINNVVFGCKRNLYFWSGTCGGDFPNYMVANNTFLNSTLYCNVEITTASTTAASYFRNNIVRQDGALPLMIHSTTFNFDHNCWYGTGGGSIAGTGDITTNPLLSGAATTFDLQYYQLQSGSPCINIGSTTSTPTTDIYGYARGSQPDFGAIEYAGTGGGGGTGTGTTYVTGASKTTYNPPITGATYYVSPTGNNGNAGTFAAPWATISYAYTRMVGGDVCYMRGGTYAERPSFSGRNGSAGNYIQFRNYLAEVPIIDGIVSNTPDYGANWSVAANYIFISGLENRNHNAGINSMGFYISGTDVIIDNCYIHHHGANGAVLQGSRNIVQNCHFYWCADLNDRSGGKPGVATWGGGCNFTGHNAPGGIPSGQIARNNYIEWTWGEGLSMWACDGAQAYDNEVNNSFSANCYVSSETHGLWDRNLSYYTDAYATQESTAGTGWTGDEICFEIGDEAYNAYPSSNVVISNNICYNGRRNMLMYGAVNAAMSNFTIINNTMINSRYIACFSTLDPTGTSVYTNFVFRNNIVRQDNLGTAALTAVYNATAYTFDHNCWSSTPEARASGTGDVVGNAQLEEATNGATKYVENWYRPISTSPCIGAGSATSAPTLDIRRVTRATYAPIDIGAIEYAVGSSSGSGGGTGTTGGGYTNVTFTNTDVIYTGSNIGTTETDFPNNRYVHTYPTTGYHMYGRAFDWDNRRALCVIANWGAATSLTVPSGNIGGLNIAAGDMYELHNCENYFADVITGQFDGTSFTIDMVNRTQAIPLGGVAMPTTMRPKFMVFQIVVIGGSNQPPPAGDTTPPSTPTGLSATAISSSQINLVWTASTDNVGVTGYRVYRGGVFISNASGTAFSDTGLSPSTLYSYAVVAFDAAGNVSAFSTSASATTLVSGANWYVSPTGGSSSTTAGTRTAPFSLSYALNGGAGGRIVAGNLVYLLDGTYSVSTYINVNGLTGTGSLPIYFKPEPGSHPIISANGTGFAPFLLQQLSWVFFYDLEFTATNYNRSTATATSAVGCHIQTDTNYTQTGIKFFGCILHDQEGMGIKSWESTTTDCEFNGCLVYYNGHDPQHDHGLYWHNNDAGEKFLKNCVVHNNASHNFHAYDDLARPVDHISLVGNVFFNQNTLYGTTGKRNVLLGGNGSTTQHPKLDQNVFYNITSVGENFRVGYGTQAATNAIITQNTVEGSTIILDNLTTTPTVNGNKIYTSQTTSSATTSLLTGGTGNTLTTIPTSGTGWIVRSYDWDTTRANIVTLNHSTTNTITIPDTGLQAAGVTIHNGSTYELHNSENYFGDVITGTYNGTGLNIPLTGHTSATPIGGIPTPTSALPIFGCFILRVLS